MDQNKLVSMHPGNVPAMPDDENYRKSVKRFNEHATALAHYVCGDVFDRGDLPVEAEAFLEALNGYCITLAVGTDTQVSYLRQKVCFLAGAAGLSPLQFWNLNEYLDSYTALAQYVNKVRPTEL
jgi:hypothetical protein